MSSPRGQGLSVALSALLLSACAAPAPRPGPTTPAAEAGGAGLNPFVLEVLRRYPTDGSYGYYWPAPSESAWEGTPHPVSYGDTRLTAGDPQRRSYCCGLTFAVYVEALLAASGGAPLSGLTADELHELRLRFFGDSSAGERRRLVEFALTSLGLGRAVTPEEARPGDFVQLWRRSGSGHQAVFVNWVWDGERRIGLTYWSSQPSTRGVGYRTEWFRGEAGVDPEQLYFARADWPVRR